MAPLPKPFDARVHWIRDLLHQGKRDEALQMLRTAIETGTAGAETRELAEYLGNAKRGRQPFGAIHLWYDIGTDNDEMRSAGISHEDRLQKLGEKYHMADHSKLKTAIAKYERAMEQTRIIWAENDSRI